MMSLVIHFSVFQEKTWIPSMPTYEYRRIKVCLLKERVHQSQGFAHIFSEEEQERARHYVISWSFLN